MPGPFPDDDVRGMEWLKPFEEPPLSFTFLQARYGFSVRLPRAPQLVSKQAIATWPGLGACERSEFAVAPTVSSDPDLYLEIYAAPAGTTLAVDEQRRWMHELASRVGDADPEPSDTWTRGALLVRDPDGLTLVVPVHNAVLLLNVDATLDLDAVADTLFGSLQQLLPKG